MTHYLVTLCGPGDDLPILITDSAITVREFCDKNRPYIPAAPRDQKGTGACGLINDARKVLGYGPGRTYGYNVLKFVDGQPVVRLTRQWDQDGEWTTQAAFDAMQPDEQKVFLDSLENNDIL